MSNLFAFHPKTSVKDHFPVTSLSFSLVQIMWSLYVIEAMKLILPPLNYPMPFISNALFQESFSEKRYLRGRSTWATITYTYHIHTAIIQDTGSNYRRIDGLRVTHSDRKRAWVTVLPLSSSLDKGVMRDKSILFSLCSHRVSVLWKESRLHRKANFRAIKCILSNLVSSSWQTSFPWEYVQMWNKYLHQWTPEYAYILVVYTEILFLT